MSYGRRMNQRHESGLRATAQLIFGQRGLLACGNGQICLVLFAEGELLVVNIHAVPPKSSFIESLAQAINQPWVGIFHT